MKDNQLETKVTIIGAGPAGLGCASLLKQMGIKPRDMLVLEANSIGSSFKSWPEEMKLITPSFPSNGYHQTDLNSITPDTSPAFSIGKEHLTGKEYAEYLSNIAAHYEIRVWEQMAVIAVEPQSDDSFVLRTKTGKTIRTQYLIWAGGEYSAPRLSDFPGSDLCLHNSQIETWASYTDPHYAIIGCYESGVDAAYNLAAHGKRVTLLDAGEDKAQTYDPSRTLSPYTGERLRTMANSDLVELVQNFSVKEVLKKQNGFELISSTGERITSTGTPINCTGFEAHLGPVKDLFTLSKDGFPEVNKFDESTIQRNLFLTGPKLVHGSILLCFIYKFRGRFATPCGTIGAELGLDMSILSHYQQAGMLLDDFACCEAQECFC